MEQAKIRKVATTRSAKSKKAKHTLLPTWVSDMLTKNSKKLDGKAPAPDPVHGVGGQYDYFNGRLVSGSSYRVGTVIGAGACGQVRLSRNVKTNEMLAVKLERENKSSDLANEWEMYKTLNSKHAEGIPQAFHFGSCGGSKALVMALLGPSLEQVYNLCDRKFSEHTVLLIGVQLITRLEHIHFNNIINRDIKPSNLLISKPPKLDKTIFLVDFGIAKYYRDPVTKRHIPFKEHNPLTGTPKYMSLNVHKGIEASRRDDLESLGNMLIYFLRGFLPWQDAIGKEMLGLKTSIRLEDLCNGQPIEFLEYMKYVRSLEFDERPNYAYLRRLFVERLRAAGYDRDGPMDWSDKVGDAKQFHTLKRMSTYKVQ